MGSTDDFVPKVHGVFSMKRGVADPGIRELLYNSKIILYNTPYCIFFASGKTLCKRAPPPLPPGSAYDRRVPTFLDTLDHA